MLYQNDLSIEYFGDVVSAAAALASGSIPNEADPAAASLREDGALGAARLCSAPDESPRTFKASCSSKFSHPPGLRLLMEFFRLQEEEDRREEEEQEGETEEEEKEEEEESEGEDDREEGRTVGEEGRGEGCEGSIRKGRKRKRNALDDIHNYRLLQDMLGKWHG